ncbi:MAG: hypothetical protein J6V26_00690 [Alistipes sp.]|nr:hypothetical protein [Alistipes sp.]
MTTRYFIRAVKYLLLLCVLYVGLEWLMLTFAPDPTIEGLSLTELLQLRFAENRGKMLVVAIIVLSALYPRFGFMTSRIEECSYERDGARIDNAMRLYGFKLIEERGDIKIYGADTILRRLMLMFEDRIEVRSIDGGIEIKGLRRSVARIAYQLQTYLHNSRFE